MYVEVFSFSNGEALEKMLQTRILGHFLLYFFFTTLVNAWACQSHDQLPFSLNLNSVNKKLHCAIPIDPFNSNAVQQTLF